MLKLSDVDSILANDHMAEMESCIAAIKKALDNGDIAEAVKLACACTSRSVHLQGLLIQVQGEYRRGKYPEAKLG